MKFAAWCSVLIGALMVAQWTLFLALGMVPEVQTEPIRLGFHVAAEVATALGLVIAGLGLLRRRTWARDAALVANGLLLYTVIVSPGYFAERGEWPLVGMFGGLMVLAVASIVQLRRAA